LGKAVPVNTCDQQEARKPVVSGGSFHDFKSEPEKCQPEILNTITQLHDTFYYASRKFQLRFDVSIRIRACFDRDVQDLSPILEGHFPVFHKNC
jgi:hypothetical protein